MTIKLPEKVRYILKTIEAAGFEAYAVGGCIRDSLLNRIPEDWDITTSAEPQQVKSLFKRTVDTGIQHGTITIMLDKEGFEVTTYRSDGDVGIVLAVLDGCTCGQTYQTAIYEIVLLTHYRLGIGCVVDMNLTIGRAVRKHATLGELSCESTRLGIGCPLGIELCEVQALNLCRCSAEQWSSQTLDGGTITENCSSTTLDWSPSLACHLKHRYKQ